MAEMISVASLLNPAAQEARSLPTPHRTPTPSEFDSASPPPSSKKPKMTKDAAVFVEGKVRGPIRYAPWEEYDPETLEELQRFRIFPLGHIARYHRHIPYNSEKKAFWEKTGRGAFEVFQYTFKMPGEDKEYNVMWDYNIGLVRITPFFKCCEYGKTIPAKVLATNPGLKEITHSITGGALAAQGYWMPFEAAKAVASTFCHSIRYALVPIFGPDFVDTCISVSGRGFGSMKISDSIVVDCTKQAMEYRDIGRAGAADSKPPSRSDSSRARTVDTWAINTVRQVDLRQNGGSSGHSQAVHKKHGLPSPQTSLASKRSGGSMFFKAKALRMSLDPLTPRLRSPPNEAAASSGSSGAPSVVVNVPKAYGTYRQSLSATPLGASSNSQASSAELANRTLEDQKAAWTLVQMSCLSASPEQNPRKRRASFPGSA